VCSSLALSPQKARSLLWLWLEGSFELIMCAALLAELARVLLRPKFRPYVTLHRRFAPTSLYFGA
jgi:predicted nucleic acid-binding protein